MTVILGSNSVIPSLPNSQIKEKAIAFYMLLKEAVRPECLILTIHIEPRFVPTGNCNRPLVAKEFNQRRQVLNNYTNKSLKRQGLVDRVIQLGSVNFLNDPQLFRDSVNLSSTGLDQYIEYALVHCLYKQDSLLPGALFS